jgi:hypothetical protein
MYAFPAAPVNNNDEGLKRHFCASPKLRLPIALSYIGLEPGDERSWPVDCFSSNDVVSVETDS